MKLPSYISSLSISNWNGRSPAGNFVFTFEGGSMTHELDKEDCEKIFAVAHEIIHRKKGEIARRIEELETPALLGYDRERTIDGSETPELPISLETPF